MTYHHLEVLHMKKLLCLVIAMLVLLLVGCGCADEATTATTESTAPTTTAVTTTPATQTTAATTTAATTTAVTTSAVTTSAVTTTAKAPITTTKNELDEILANKTKLSFGDDGEFRVLCLADLHLQSGRTAGVLQNVKTMVAREKPDLIILLGDIVTDPSIQTVTQFKSVLGSIVNYFEENNIYWMHVFGNHDTEVIGTPLLRLTTEEQQKIYESYPHCLSKAGDKDLSGVGNYLIPLYGADEEVKFAFWGIDSGSYLSPDDKDALFGDKKSSYSGIDQSNVQYDFVHFDQIEWYLKVSRLLEKENGALVPGLMAMHIPLQETFTAWENRSSLEWTGQKNEYVSAGCHNAGFFEAMRYRGDIKSCVFGHDHNNDYMVNYSGIKLCFSSTVSTLGYYMEEMMGARVYVIKENDPANFDTYISYLKEQIEKPTESLSGTVTDFEEMTEDDLILNHWENSTLNLDTVTATVAEGKGVNGSNALAACRTAWYSEGWHNNMEVKWNLAEPGLLGDNKYLVVWMDFATNNVDFRKASFGLFTDGNTSNAYRTDDLEVAKKGAVGVYYYKADGSDTWVEMKMGKDNCFGYGDANSQGDLLAGRKGYFAFPIADMYKGANALNANSAITGVYFYMSALSQEMAGKPVYVDNIQLVADYKTVK